MTAASGPSLITRMLAALREGADQADRLELWPENSLRELWATGWGGAQIPAAWGGLGLALPELLEISEELGAACLTTGFILSQREAAVKRLLQGPEGLKNKYLPRLARGDVFLTVGLSHLTTSRQHCAPPLTAREEGTHWILQGEIPWVTGADRAEAVVIGATLDDGQQILLVLPTDLPGVTVSQPMDLSALRGSRTAQVRCESVRVPRHLALCKPAEKVLGPVGGGGLETSALALGLVKAALEYLAGEAIQRPHLVQVADRLRERYLSARATLMDLAENPEPRQVTDMRSRVTLLGLDATRVGLTAAMGAGFIANHPAGRWARQALFFLVWSCPRPVSAELLTAITGQDIKPA